MNRIVGRLPSAYPSLRGNSPENVDRDVRTKLGDCGRVRRRSGNVEPVTIDKVAGRLDSPQDVVGGDMLAARLSTHASEHHHFRICLAGLSRGCPDELSVELRIPLEPLRLNVKDVCVSGSVGGKTKPQISLVLMFSVAVGRQNRDEVDGGRGKEQQASSMNKIGSLLQVSGRILLLFGRSEPPLFIVIHDSSHVAAQRVGLKRIADFIKALE